MNNPFEKNDHTILIAGVIVGILTGAGLACLFITKKGAAYREQITSRFKETVSNTAANVISKKTVLPKKAAKAVTDIAIK